MKSNAHVSFTSSESPDITRAQSCFLLKALSSRWASPRVVTYDMCNHVRKSTQRHRCIHIISGCNLFVLLWEVTADHICRDKELVVPHCVVCLPVLFFNAITTQWRPIGFCLEPHFGKQLNVQDPIVTLIWRQNGLKWSKLFFMFKIKKCLLCKRYS